jgi:antitoxin component YwqK of YwqJK toxin-antitoxin module
MTVLCLTAACGAPASKQPAGNNQIKPTYDERGVLTRLEYDRNGDGTIETWGYMNGTRVVRVEADENGDGQVDRWEYHKEGVPPGVNPSGGDRTLDRVERAKRFDGKVSRREFFENGYLARVEEDVNGDGLLDKWETYQDGKLSVLALDTTKKLGKPTRRLLYGADGNFDHIESDPTGSGIFTPLKP